MQRFFFIFLLFSCLLPDSSATHIVGGEMSYKCVGNNQYQIFLTIYRDCKNGQPWFDSPAFIGIFDKNNKMVDSIQIFPMGNDTLPLIFPDTCLVASDTVCVHRTSYAAQITLLPTTGGYNIVYARCCRNKIIDNIVDPENTGATFSIFISDDAMSVCNTSPRFRQWPPVNICAGFNIQFDHGATDADGDSLVYTLCTPLIGFRPFDPGGNKYPDPPPYKPVEWNAPIYSLTNMLGSAVPLTIDPKTGFLDGIPDITGQFVIGICMEEYRNGKLLSITRRDFQYNVGYCTVAKAAYFAPSILCDNQTVTFTNQSQNGSTFEWSFNDPKIPGGGTSNLKNPIFTFSDTGLYSICLIINKGSICTDTFVKSINLQRKSIKANFSPKSFYCIDTAQINVNNVTIDSSHKITQLQWTLFDAQNKIIDSTTQAKPIFSVQDNQTYKIRLIAISSNGCIDTLINQVVVPKNPTSVPPLLVTATPDTVYAGQPTQLLATFYTDFLYNWKPTDSLSNPNIFNPIARPTVNTIYDVTVANPNGCSTKGKVTVTIRNGSCDDPYVFIPNTFTPNGDGVNDVLYVRGGIIEDLEWVIYNRWGQKVFESRDKISGWDGTFNGEELPNEVFAYTLTSKCKNGQTFVKKGNVSILR